MEGKDRIFFTSGPEKILKEKIKKNSGKFSA